MISDLFDELGVSSSGNSNYLLARAYCLSSSLENLIMFCRKDLYSERFRSKPNNTFCFWPIHYNRLFVFPKTFRDNKHERYICFVMEKVYV